MLHRQGNENYVKNFGDAIVDIFTLKIWRECVKLTLKLV
jgi:hypothetical protein